MALSYKQQAFVEAYLQTWNATEAARQAGYRHPNVQGPRLSQDECIKKLIDRRLKELQISQEQVPNQASRRQACYVYLIRAENGLVKIGKTCDVDQRFKTIDIACPVSLELLGYIETALADELEESLHAHFAENRVKGEWFALDENEVIEALKWLG